MRSTAGPGTPDGPIVPDGRWWRHDDYVLSNGILTPAPGARWQVYDPWTEHDPARPAPYLELSNLCRDLPLGGELAGPLDRRQVERVLDWCRRFGLPGTLLHRTEAIFLAQRWQPISLFPGAPATPFTIPTQLYYFFDAVRWSANARHSLSVLRESDLSTPNSLVADADCPADGFPLVALMRPVAGGALKAEPLAHSWGSYFPSVRPLDRATFDYPLPMSDAFVALYAEPLDQFIAAGNAFTEALEALTAPAGETRFSPQDGERVFGSLLADVATTVSRAPDGTLRERSRSRSLIGTLAAMAKEDLLRGNVRRCPRCNQLFRSVSYQGRYCSPRCRNTFQKRVQRARPATPRRGLDPT